MLTMVIRDLIEENNNDEHRRMIIGDFKPINEPTRRNLSRYYLVMDVRNGYEYLDIVVIELTFTKAYEIYNKYKEHYNNSIRRDMQYLSLQKLEESIYNTSEETAV